MKSLVVGTFACLVALAAGAAYMSHDVKYADPALIEKQHFFLDVLQYVYQDEVVEQKYGDRKDYKIQDNLDNYSNVKRVQKFLDWHEKNPVPKGEIFTIFNKHHRYYANRLMHAFYYAKDFETFKSTVVWAYFNVNKDVWVYATYLVAFHHPDMQGIVMPAIYEVLPFYFFNSETIEKAQQFVMQGFSGVKQVEGVYDVVIPSNYSGAHGQVNMENLVSYFTEDIGLNEFYFNYNLDYPFWSSGAPEKLLTKDRRGAFYLSLHQQLLARYTMERLSNNLPDVEELNIYSESLPGYYPALRYYSGAHFPDRENEFGHYHPDNFYNADMVHLYSRRILDAIDYKYAVLRDGKHFALNDVKTSLETLGNMLQGNKDSVNTQIYGHLDQLLRDMINSGYPTGPRGHETPGVMHHYQTSIRDPAFFQMYKYLMRFYWHYMEQLPSYKKTELTFDGVKITGAEIDKLTTYFDKFDADITQAVAVDTTHKETETDLHKFGRVSTYNGHDFVIKARQQRLNHLPFTFKLTVTSTKAQKATVKVMLGPKYDCYGKKIDLNENRKNFFELDYFLVDLVEGENTITRSCSDYSWYINDRTSYLDLYKKVFQAVKGNKKFPLDMSEAHCGFPNRLMLPKGKKGGMPFQFFFFVAPYHEPTVKQFTGYDPTVSCGIGSGARYLDDTTFSYPLDRVIDIKNWYLDNMYYLDTMIYHKSEADVHA